MSKPKEETKTREIIASLASPDEKIALRALKSAKTHGNVEVFHAILSQLLTTSNESFKNEILNYLDDLKSTEALPILMTYINDEKYAEFHARFIGVFWNCPLNPNDFISVFVKKAITGDFMVAMECSTTIQAIEPPFPEEEVIESILLLKEYFSSNPEGNKVELIKDILKIIKEMENSVNLS